MALVLGFVLDWWEQPPFTVFLATLAGLALSAEARPADMQLDNTGLHGVSASIDTPQL